MESSWPEEMFHLLAVKLVAMAILMIRVLLLALPAS